MQFPTNTSPVSKIISTLSELSNNDLNRFTVEERKIIEKMSRSLDFTQVVKPSVSEKQIEKVVTHLKKITRDNKAGKMVSVSKTTQIYRNMMSPLEKFNEVKSTLTQKKVNISTVSDALTRLNQLDPSELKRFSVSEREIIKKMGSAFADFEFKPQFTTEDFNKIVKHLDKIQEEPGNWVSPLTHRAREKEIKGETVQTTLRQSVYVIHYLQAKGLYEKCKATNFDRYGEPLKELKSLSKKNNIFAMYYQAEALKEIDKKEGVKTFNWDVQSLITNINMQKNHPLSVRSEPTFRSPVEAFHFGKMTIDGAKDIIQVLKSFKNDSIYKTQTINSQLEQMEKDLISIIAALKDTRLPKDIIPLEYIKEIDQMLSEPLAKNESYTTHHAMKPELRKALDEHYARFE